MSAATAARTLRTSAAFVLAAGAIVLLCLQGGGAYDLVVRHEAAVIVWGVLAAGFAIGVLPVQPWPRIGSAAVGGLGLFAVWMALGLIWTSSAERTEAELARVVFYLGIVVLGLSIVGRRTWKPVIAGVFAGAGVVVVLALLSRLYPGSFPAQATQTNGSRLSYPFGYWNAVGCLTAMVALAGLAISAGARPLAARAVAAAFAFVSIPTLYLTYSRGAIGAAAIGILVLLLLTSTRVVLAVHALVAVAVGVIAILVIRSHHAIAVGHGVSGRGAVLVIVVAGAIVAAATAWLTGHARLDGRLQLSTRQTRVGVVVVGVLAVVALAVAVPTVGPRAWSSFEQRKAAPVAADPAKRLTNLSGARIDLWHSDLDAFNGESLHGIGPGTFEFWWNQDSRYSGFVRDSHSLYLETLGEAGIVGALLLVAALASLLVGTVVSIRGRPDRAAWTAGGAAAFVAWALFAGYDWMWESPAVTVIALGGAAVVIGGRSRGRIRRRAILPRIAATVVSVVALLIMLPALSSTSQVRGSQQAAARGDLTLALARANGAVDAEPWAATPYLQRALVEELGGNLRAAAIDARRSADRGAQDYRPWLALSRIEAEQGRVGAALRAFRQAQRRKPALVPRRAGSIG